jgi:hypothetical protein
MKIEGAVLIDKSAPQLSGKYRLNTIKPYSAARAAALLPSSVIRWERFGSPNWTSSVSCVALIVAASPSSR